MARGSCRRKATTAEARFTRTAWTTPLILTTSSLKTCSLPHVLTIETLRRCVVDCQNSRDRSQLVAQDRPPFYQREGATGCTFDIQTMTLRMAFGRTSLALSLCARATRTSSSQTKRGALPQVRRYLHAQILRQLSSGGSRCRRHKRLHDQHGRTIRGYCSTKQSFVQRYEPCRWRSHSMPLSSSTSI